MLINHKIGLYNSQPESTKHELDVNSILINKKRNQENQGAFFIIVFDVQPHFEIISTIMTLKT